MAEQTSIYIWRGLDRDNRPSSGEVEAGTLREARLKLRRRQIRVRRIHRQAVGIFGRGNRVTPHDIVFFTRQLATMIEAGIPISRALNGIMRGSEKPGMRRLLRRITESVEAGNPLSTALKQYPKYFDNLYVSLVSIGEQSGLMGTLLEKVAVHVEKIQSIKGKVRSALTYPIVTLLVTFGLTAIMLVKVIPEFAKIFDSLGAELPWMTQVIMQASEVFRESWMPLLAVTAAATVLLIRGYSRSPRIRRFVDRCMLHIPIFGRIFRDAVIARFARNASIMSGAGITLVDLLETVAHAAGNQVYREAILDLRREVGSGRPISDAMTDTRLFPDMVVQMIGVGEESGELQSMLENIADFYDGEVDNAVATLSSLIEPILIVVIGALVGGIIVAMYLPLFQLGSVL